MKNVGDKRREDGAEDKMADFPRLSFLVISLLILSLLVLSLVGLPMSAVAAADPLDGWRIVQVSATDRLAVAKSPDGVLRLMKEGDRLGENVAVIGFDSERVILERPGRWGRATLFVRVVDGRQQVERREVQPLRKSAVNGNQAEVKLIGTQ